MRKRMAVVAVASLLVAGLSAVTAEPATAWTGPSRTVSNHTTPLDWCPGNASICQDTSRLTTLAANTAVTMVCWIDARHMTGYTYNRWFYITVGSNQGFVKAERVANQNPSTPWCLDNASVGRRAVNASLYATGLDDYHQVYPTSTDKANYRTVYGGSDSDWGVYGDWSGECPIFVGLAWWLARVKIHTGSTAAAIGASYSLHMTGTPPRGAAVFWKGGVDGSGHVAISLGNGRVVSTSGYENQRLQTTDHPTSYFSSPLVYMGWVQNP